jgi:hypothetical protein
MRQMKRLITAMLGLSLLFGTVAVSAQDKGGTNKGKKKRPGKKSPKKGGKGEKK